MAATFIRVAVMGARSHSVDPPTYSFVIPVYNEEEALEALRDRLIQVLARLDGGAEVLLVDDGSTDRSWDLIGTLHDQDARFRGVRLSRNFGKEVAMTAGMDLARGEAVIVMDGDLQDPPEAVLEMAARWRDGYDVVSGVRGDRSSNGVFKRTSAKLFYRTRRRLSDVDVPQSLADFRLTDRRVVDAVGAMREGNRYTRGLCSWVGYRQTAVTYRRDTRFAGDTKFPLKKLVGLACDGVFSFSRVPLRVAMKLGAAAAALSSFAAIMALVLKLSDVYSVPGWASILFAVCLLGSIQLVVLGVLGQYAGRIHEETLSRPLYVAGELRGLGRPALVPDRAVFAGTTGSRSGIETDDTGEALAGLAVAQQGSVRG
jgi:dolichol-phosphate mannosyltransferase